MRYPLVSHFNSTNRHRPSVLEKQQETSPRKDHTVTQIQIRDMITIGQRIETSDGIFYELESNGEGNIYKNEDAFLKRPDEVCYIPEHAAEDHEGWQIPENEDCFTHNSLLRLCKESEEICCNLFYSLEWTFPSTLLDEWDMCGYFDEERKKES